MAGRTFRLVAPSGEAMVLAARELPAAAAEIIDVLRAVAAPLATWLDIAVEYQRQRRTMQSLEVHRALQTAAMDPKLPYVRGADTMECVARSLLSTACCEALAASTAPVSAPPAAGAASGGVLTRAQRLASAAASLDTATSSFGDRSRWVIANRLARIAVEVSRSSMALSTTLTAPVVAPGARPPTGAEVVTLARKMRADVLAASSKALGDVIAAIEKQATSELHVRLLEVPALLLSGVLAYQNGEVEAARTHFAAAIRTYPAASGAAARIGLGMCLFHLGHTAMARKAFHRALELEPDHPHANTLVAVMESIELVEIAALEASTGTINMAARVARQNAVLERLRHAFQRSTSNPLTLLQMAQVYSTRWTPLMVSPAPSAGSAAGGAGRAVTAIVTRGSCRLILSEDARMLLHRDQMLKLWVTVAAAPGEAATSVGVPMRLTTEAHIAVVPVSALGTLVAVNPALSAMPSSAAVCVVRCRRPWGLATQAAVPVTVIDTDRVIKAAKAASESTTNVALRVDALYVWGRAEHVCGRFADAHVHYKSCLELNPDYLPAKHGMAQTSITLKRYDDAVKLLRAVLDKRPDDRSACRTLAHLHAMQRRQGDAVEMARRAYEVAPWDVQLCALYTSLLATTDTPAAVDRCLSITTQTAQRIRRSGQAVPPALLNNAGVLYMRKAVHDPSLAARRGHLAAAAQELDRAAALAAQEMFPGRSLAELAIPAVRDACLYSPYGVTIGFNVARLREMQGYTTDAAAMYGAIVASMPNYYDAHIRLAMMAHVARDREQAAREAKAALSAARAFIASTASVTARHHASAAAVTAQTFLGQIADEAGDATSAAAHLRGALSEPGFETDAYATIALTNLAFRDVYNADDVTKEGILRSCFDRYKAVLRPAPQCLYAGLGLGMVVAEQGRLEVAREVMTVLREANQDALPVAIDLAHLQAAMGHTAAAAQLYAHVSKRLGDVCDKGSTQAVIEGGFGASSEDSVGVLLYTARAHSHAEDYAAAIPLLTKAMMYRPSDLRVRFNLAYVLSKLGYVLTSVDVRKRGVEEMERGIEHLRTAIHMFAGVKALVASFLDELLPKAEARARDARDKAVRAAAEVAERQVALAARLAASKQSSNALEEAAAAVHEKNLVKLRELQGRFSSLVSEPSSKAARGGDGDDGGGSGGGAGERSSGGGITASRVAPRSRKKPAVPRARAKAAAATTTTTSGDDGETAADGPRRRPKKKRARRRGPFGESDDEDDAAPAASKADSSSSSDSDSDSDSDSSDSDSSSSESGGGGGGVDVDAEADALFGALGDEGGEGGGGAAASSATLADLFGEEVEANEGADGDAGGGDGGDGFEPGPQAAGAVSAAGRLRRSAGAGAGSDGDDSDGDVAMTGSAAAAAAPGSAIGVGAKRKGAIIDDDDD